LTVIDGVVAPLLHNTLLPGAVLMPSCTVPPSQKVVLPLADMLPEGIGFTVTVALAGADVQPSAVAVTEYVPEAFAVMDDVVAPVLHSQLTPPVLVEAVSVTLPPEQKTVLPLADMAGVVGFGLTVTVMLLVVMVQPAGEVTCAE
jgi:hypothetical protein